MPVEKALTRFGLEVQFSWSADPASWDPLWKKSPVHAAVLKAGLKKRNNRNNPNKDEIPYFLGSQ